MIARGFKLEARVGIEPTYKGFADLSLTTWVPRLFNDLTTILLLSTTQLLHSLLDKDIQNAAFWQCWRQVDDGL